MSCSSCEIDLNIFATDYVASVQTSFAQTQAFAVPGTSAFCQVANDRICADYEAKYACCCQEQMAAWQNCLVENVFSQDLGLSEPCQSTCGASDSAGGSGGVPGAMIAGVVGAIIAAAVLCWYGWRRRRGRNAHRQPEATVNQKDIEEGISTSTSDASPDNMINRFVCGGMDQPSNDEPSVSSIYNDDDKEYTQPSRLLGVVQMNPSMISGGTQKFGDDEVDEDELHDRKAVASTKQVTSKARDKKKAIEAWNESRKQGSSKSLGLSIASGEDSLSPMYHSDSDLAPKSSTLTTRGRRSSKSGDKRNSSMLPNRPSRSLSFEELWSTHPDHTTSTNKGITTRKASNDNARQDSKRSSQVGVNRKSSKSPARSSSRSRSAERRRSSSKKKQPRATPDDVTAQLAALTAAMEASSATVGSVVNRVEGSLVDNKSSLPPKKISSRDLKKLMKERDESTKRVSTLEVQKAEIEDRIMQVNTEAEILRCEFSESQRRIKQLEEENLALRLQKASSSSSSSSRDAAESVDTAFRRRLRRSGSYTELTEEGDERSSREVSSGRHQSKSRSTTRRVGDQQHNSSRSLGSLHSIDSFRDVPASKLDELTTSWNHESLFALG